MTRKRENDRSSDQSQKTAGSPQLAGGFSRRISGQQLRQLRNELPIMDLIVELGLESKRRGTQRRFQCPKCARRQLVVNQKTNLARCFACAQNYNPIDLAMSALSVGFVEAISQLQTLLERTGTDTNHGGRR